MMDDDDSCHYFDAMESDCDENGECVECWDYDVWTGPLRSVKERRMSFFRRFGLSSGRLGECCSDFEFNGEVVVDQRGAAVLRSTEEEEPCTSASSISGSKKDESFDHFMRAMPEVKGEAKALDGRPKTMDQLKDKWLRKWRSMTRTVLSKVKQSNVRWDKCNQFQSTLFRRVQVRNFLKNSKELSALFVGQDIQAHEGSILSMKFSFDGQYLASAGEDKVVRVWQVVEDERPDIIDRDVSSVYFSMNRFSQLRPLVVPKEKSGSIRKTHDSACVIFPHKVFKILEKPLHIFKGHDGAILDLSWSKNNCLLSSSADKTVRLWKVGVDQCLKVFRHTDYVTCIQFNPMDDDQFVSGSIDRKVRIWTISGCQVVRWTETKDIITAISYSPDGKGGVFGSILGTCRFFNISDCIQLESQVCLITKRKLPDKRIIGVLYLPQDPTKVLVSCADSSIRIIQGTNVILKYKGSQKVACSVFAASFTLNGKHIISESEDSNVYLWNYINQDDEPIAPHPKTIEFLPCDASIAVPWPGLKHSSSSHYRRPIFCLPFSSHSYQLDSVSKGSATWPEEKLPISVPRMVSSPLGNPQFKFLKTSLRSSSGMDAFGLVFVTASRSGRIRSFHTYGLPVSL